MISSDAGRTHTKWANFAGDVIVERVTDRVTRGTRESKSAQIHLAKVGASQSQTALLQPAPAALRSHRVWLLRLMVIATAAATAGAGKLTAQTSGKVAADQHAAVIRAQVSPVFRLTSTTGSVSELQNHIVINSPGAVYSVRKSNVLIASFSSQHETDDSSDSSVANTAGRWVPVSKKCRYVTTISPPGFTTPPITDACRRDLAMGKARFIASGQRVLLAGVDVSVDRDRAEFLLLEYHKPKGILSPRFVSQFAVQFPAGFLMTADAAQIAAAIKPFLAPSDDQSVMSKPYLADAPPPAYSLEDNLAAAYSSRAYQLEAGTSGPGTLLKVKADRFMRAIPQGLPAIGCTPVLQDGSRKGSGQNVPDDEPEQRLHAAQRRPDGEGGQDRSEERQGSRTP